MAELATAAFGSIFGGLGLGGAATTAATTVGAGVASAGSGALAALSGISTVFKVLGSIGAANASARADNQAADQAVLQAGQEQLAGEQRKTKMTRELARVLGQNEVAYAAAGIDLTQGVAQDSSAAAKERAATEISIDQQDTDFRRSLYRMRASGLRDRARATKGGALIGALGDVAGYGIKLAEMG